MSASNEKVGKKLSARAKGYLLLFLMVCFLLAFLLYTCVRAVFARPGRQTASFNAASANEFPHVNDEIGRRGYP